MIVRLLGAASLADGAWQFIDRKGWARFWAKSLVRLRKPTAAAQAIAAGELLLGVWLIARRRNHAGGDAVKFKVSPGHHPITAA